MKKYIFYDEIFDLFFCLKTVYDFLSFFFFF